MKSCENSDILVFDHFADGGKMVQIGSDAQREQKDYKLTHYNIGKNIREVIAKNGGTMPEDLPTPKKSLKQLEKENKKS